MLNPLNNYIWSPVKNYMLSPLSNWSGLLAFLALLVTLGIVGTLIFAPVGGVAVTVLIVCAGVAGAAFIFSGGMWFSKTVGQKESIEIKGTKLEAEALAKLINEQKESLLKSDEFTKALESKLDTLENNFTLMQKTNHIKQELDKQEKLSMKRILVDVSESLKSGTLLGFDGKPVDKDLANNVSSYIDANNDKFSSNALNENSFFAIQNNKPNVAANDASASNSRGVANNENLEIFDLVISKESPK